MEPSIINNGNHKFDIIVNTAIEMLLENKDIFVQKNDFTPQKVNAKQGGFFSKNDVIFEQQVDLCWTSRKGFRIGVVFYGCDRPVVINDCFPVGSNTYIAQFDLAGIFVTLAQRAVECDTETIRQILTEPNTFSSWLYWPQFPVRIAQHFQLEDSQQDISTAYEQHIFQAWTEIIQPPAPSIQAIYKGCKRIKSTGELVYRFCITHGDKFEDYHLIAFEGDFYLLDYIYNSVPLDTPHYQEILSACRKKTPLR